MSRYVDIDSLEPQQFENSEVELGVLAYDYEAVQSEPYIDIVICEECRWQDDCSRFVKSMDGLVSTALMWCSDGVRREE